MNKMKKIIISVAIIITVTIGLVLGLGGTYLYNLALDPTTDKSIVFGSDEESTETISQNETSGEVNIDAEAWLLNDSGYESLYRTSKDGLKLHNYLIKNNSKNGLSQCMVILLKESLCLTMEKSFMTWDIMFLYQI